MVTTITMITLWSDLEHSEHTYGWTFKKADWGKFSALTRDPRKNFMPHRFWTIFTFDREVKLLYRDLMSCILKVCSRIRVRKKHTNPCWSDHLSKQRRSVSTSANTGGWRAFVAKLQGHEDEVFFNHIPPGVGVLWNPQGYEHWHPYKWGWLYSPNLPTQEKHYLWKLVAKLDFMSFIWLECYKRKLLQWFFPRKFCDILLIPGKPSPLFDFLTKGFPWFLRS